MTKSKSLHFRPFLLSDREACLAVFDTNCPEFFAPNERRNYEQFLAGNPSTYEVWIRSHKIVGAYGFKISSERNRSRISWIMVDASARGKGLSVRKTLTEHRTIFYIRLNVTKTIYYKKQYCLQIKYFAARRLCCSAFDSS